MSDHRMKLLGPDGKELICVGDFQKNPWSARREKRANEAMEIVLPKLKLLNLNKS